MSTENRINELESRLAFQDDTIQALNDELVTQQRVIERLRMQVDMLAKRQEELSSGSGGIAQDDAPPPHY